MGNFLHPSNPRTIEYGCVSRICKARILTHFSTQKCRILQVRGGCLWNEKVRKAALSLAFRTLLDCKKHKNGGEGGIRTHVPRLRDNPISSRARYGQLRYLSAKCACRMHTSEGSAAPAPFLILFRSGTPSPMAFTAIVRCVPFSLEASVISSPVP